MLGRTKHLSLAVCSFTLSSFFLLAGPGAASAVPNARLDVGTPPLTMVQDDIVDIAKDVVDKLAAEDFEGVTEHFNEQMRQGLPVEKIEQTWTGVVQQIGSFESQGTPRRARQGEGRGVLIRCKFERGAAQVDVWFDRNDEIAGLWIHPAR